MFDWDILSKYDIKKAEKSDVKTWDGIHCEECGEHDSDHAIKDGALLHPTDVLELFRKK